MFVHAAVVDIRRVPADSQSVPKTGVARTVHPFLVPVNPLDSTLGRTCCSVRFVNPLLARPMQPPPRRLWLRQTPCHGVLCSTTSIGKEHLCEVTCRHTIYLTQRSGLVHLLASLCVSDSRPPISPSFNNRTGRFINNPYSPEVECPHSATTYLSRGPDLLL